MATYLYVIIRLLLWFGAVTVSVLPVLLHHDVDLEFGLSSNMAIVNKAGLFREFFFVVVVVSVLSLSSTIEYLCKKFYKLPGTAFALAILGIFFNIVALSSGLVGFMRIPHGIEVADATLHTYSWLILLALAFSLITEICVALEHRR